MALRDPRVPPYEALEQQHRAAQLGMWVLIATEVLFFGALFTTYTALRWLHAGDFALASQHVSYALGTLNTGVLLTSSLTMALAVRAAQLGKRHGQVAALLVTAGLGITFLILKFVDYASLYREGLVPGAYHPHVAMPEAGALFYGLFFFMTGLHALHVLIGVGLMLVLALLAHRGAFSPRHHPLLENAGLYWHFVDVVWVFLYPLFYLMGRHG